MVDGFHWTRVTSKQLRFLYEELTLQVAPAHMRELAATIDRRLAAEHPATAHHPATDAPAATEGAGGSSRDIGND